MKLKDLKIGDKYMVVGGSKVYTREKNDKLDISDHIRMELHEGNPEVTPVPNSWPDPTPAMLNDPLFNKIWNTIKTWDINVPGIYEGYCSATGNHVRAIYEAIKQ